MVRPTGNDEVGDQRKPVANSSMDSASSTTMTVDDDVLASEKELAALRRLREELSRVRAAWVASERSKSDMVRARRELCSISKRARARARQGKHPSMARMRGVWGWTVGGVAALAAVGLAAAARSGRRDVAEKREVEGGTRA